MAFGSAHEEINVWITHKLALKLAKFLAAPGEKFDWAALSQYNQANVGLLTHRALGTRCENSSRLTY